MIGRSIVFGKQAEKITASASALARIQSSVAATGTIYTGIDHPLRRVLLMSRLPITSTLTRLDVLSRIESISSATVVLMSSCRLEAAELGIDLQSNDRPPDGDTDDSEIIGDQ
jgi:hypothetical protein